MSLHKPRFAIIASRLRAHDAMVQKQAEVVQQRVRFAKVGVKLSGTDLLEHSDGGNFGVAAGQIPIVALANRHLSVQSALLQYASGQRRLLPAQRAAERGCAIPLGGVNQKAAPAASNVEETIALAQIELAADIVELGLLRRFQRFIAGRKVSACVNHSGVEKLLVELV